MATNPKKAAASVKGKPASPRAAVPTVAETAAAKARAKGEKQLDDLIDKTRKIVDATTDLLADLRKLKQKRFVFTDVLSGEQKKKNP